MSGALVKLLLAPTLVGPCAQTVIDRMTGDCVFEAVTGPLIPAELVEPASPLPFLAGHRVTGRGG